jgi:hypothetical protein
VQAVAFYVLMKSAFVGKEVLNLSKCTENYDKNNTNLYTLIFPHVHIYMRSSPSLHSHKFVKCKTESYETFHFNSCVIYASYEMYYMYSVSTEEVG